MWFERLVGFREETPNQVRSNLRVEGDRLISQVNGQSFQAGRLEAVSLQTLRDRAAKFKGTESRKTTIGERVANVQDLHQAAENAGALFQVASQFNLLEMVGPSVTPERGVDGYEFDRTQGPACAIACGAGTIYRNYFAPLPNGQIGQTAEHQLDCLEDLGDALGNQDGSLWSMENGYALASASGLEKINDQLENLGEGKRDALRARLRIGLHWDTEVTLDSCGHHVTQAYCSALPVAYSHLGAPAWEAFARLVLEAAYEATFQAALINRDQTACSKVFLTLLGGGAFGNRTEWIFDAIKRATQLFEGQGLDVAVVSYGYSDPSVQRLVNLLNGDSEIHDSSSPIY